MEVSTIIMTHKGIINTVRNIVDTEKAEKVFGELIRENDRFATEDNIEVALENGEYENTNGLDITILQTLIEVE